MSKLRPSLQGSTASASVMEKGSPVNAIVAVLMALVLAIGLMPLPGYSGQAFAEEEGEQQQGTAFDPMKATTAPLAEGGATEDTPREPSGYGVAITQQDSSNVYTAAFTGQGLVKHKNANGVEAYWMGIAIPNMKGINSKWGAGEYSEDAGSDYTGVGTDNIRTKQGYSDGGYDDFWFKLESDRKAFVAVYANGKDQDPVVYQLDFSGVTCVYNVNTTTSEDGTVTVADTAVQGSEVSIDATPNNGYELKEIKVTDAKSQEVTVADNKFIMPASDVTVTATFKSTEAAEEPGSEGGETEKVEYNVTVAESENGTVTADPAKAAEGTEVTLTVEAADGYELDTLTAKSGSDDVKVADNKFIMPAGDVTVTATFKSTEAAEEPGSEKENAGAEDNAEEETTTDTPGTTPTEEQEADGTKTEETKTDGTKADEAKDTETKTDEQHAEDQESAYTPSENALTDEETGVIVDGDILAELPEGVQSFELDVTETVDKESVAKLAEQYAEQIEGGEVAGVFEVDLKAAKSDGTTESLTEGIGQMKLTFPVEIENGTIVKVIQLHATKDADNPEVIEHPLQRVADGKVAITLDDKLSTFIITTQAETKDMYRLYNPYSGEHHYTSKVEERDYLKEAGWVDEGKGWTAPTLTETPVYRLYNPYEPLGDHHYTTNEKEYKGLIEVGWVDEGIGWYSADEQGAPLYRVYNPNAYAMQMSGAHHYTADKAEAEGLADLGWVYEEIAWYGIAAEEAEAADAEKADADKADATADAEKTDAVADAEKTDATADADKADATADAGKADATADGEKTDASADANKDAETNGSEAATEEKAA